jgi:hypothetical protein
LKRLAWIVDSMRKRNGDETQMTTKSQHEQLPKVAIIATATLQAKLLSLRCRGGF